MDEAGTIYTHSLTSPTCTDSTAMYLASLAGLRFELFYVSQCC